MLSLPDPTYHEDNYIFEWTDLAVRMEVSRLSETRDDDVRGELLVISSDPVKGGTLYSGRLLCVSSASLRDIPRACWERDPETDWSGLLGMVRNLTLRRFRQGAPITSLRERSTERRPRFLIEPLIYSNGISQVYGHGETAKSLLSLVLALAVVSGEEIASLSASQCGSVLYLDWEDDAESHAERLHALCASAGLPVPANIYHRRMTASLTASAASVRKQVIEHDVKLVIIDSLGLACGGDPNDPAAIINALLAARSLATSVLVLHHLPKDAKDKSAPYGSVFAYNEVRLSWHVEGNINRGEGITEIRNTYRCYKGNRGGRLTSFSLGFTLRADEWDELTAIEAKRLDWREVPEAQGQKWRVHEVLKRGACTAHEIAEATGIKENQVRAVMSRNKGMFVRVGEDEPPRYGNAVQNVGQYRQQQSATQSAIERTAGNLAANARSGHSGDGIKPAPDSQSYRVSLSTDGRNIDRNIPQQLRKGIATPPPPLGGVAASEIPFRTGEEMAGEACGRCQRKNVDAYTPNGQPRCQACLDEEQEATA